MAKPDLAVVDGGRSDALDPPEHLGEDGRACWNEQVEDLQRLGVVDQVDLSLVEQAAEMYEGRRQAQRAVAKHGQMVQGRKGLKKNPAVSKHLEYGKEYRQCIKEIARLKASATPRDDESDDPFTF